MISVKHTNYQIIISCETIGSYTFMLTGIIASINSMTFNEFLICNPDRQLIFDILSSKNTVFSCPCKMFHVCN